MPSIKQNQNPKPILQDNFSPVPVTLLQKNEQIPFELYIKSKNKNYTLYSSPKVILDQKLTYRLDKLSTGRVWVKNEDLDTVNAYFQNHLSRILQSPWIKQDDKAQILYSTSSSVMRSVFEDPTSPELISNVEPMVNNLETFLFQGSGAFTSLIKMVSHDYYTYTHCLNACFYSMSIGKKLGLSKSDRSALGLGSILHDIGKVKVSPSIINKKGKLNDNEWVTIKQHPGWGVEVVKDRNLSESTLAIIEQHHEKIDGSGYPKGLKEKEIHPLAQIVTVVDIFDALTTNRSYSTAKTYFEGLRFMSEKLRGKIKANILSTLIRLLGGR